MAAPCRAGRSGAHAAPQGFGWPEGEREEAALPAGQGVAVRVWFSTSEPVPVRIAESPAASWCEEQAESCPGAQLAASQPFAHVGKCVGKEKSSWAKLGRGNSGPCSPVALLQEHPSPPHLRTRQGYAEHRGGCAERGGSGISVPAGRKRNHGAFHTLRVLFCFVLPAQGAVRFRRVVE